MHQVNPGVDKGKKINLYFVKLFNICYADIMRIPNLKKLSLATLAVSLVPLSALAEVTAPRLFGDHMVLPDGDATPIWGNASGEKSVSVSFLDPNGSEIAQTQTDVDPNGNWLVRLGPLQSGDAGSLRIEGDSGATLSFDDVVVGQVWFAAGQSNMRYNIGYRDAPQENQAAASKEATAVIPQIRFFTVGASKPYKPADNLKGAWKIIGPDNIRSVSAVAWYFALTLNRELDCPVGLIVSAWGGTPVEAWTPMPKLESDPVGRDVVARHERKIAAYPELKKAYDQALADWEAANPTDGLKKKNANSKPKEPYSMNSSHVPSRIYNGMVYPVAPFAITGAIWYQGENNAYRPSEYDALIKLLVTGWRERWERDFPFYYVELANLYPKQQAPVEIERQPGHEVPSWAYIRETQEGALELPATGVVTAADVGLFNNIHPPDKKSVGQRLGNLALVEVYGLNLPNPHSPSLNGFTREGDKLRLSFNDAEGLRLRGDALAGFAIKGEDTDWVWAKGRIDGEDILLWSDEVRSPVAARYGWATNPILSVENSSGLPLRPFRTDKDSDEWDGFINE